jgi:hypothetical protein
MRTPRSRQAVTGISAGGHAFDAAPPAYGERTTRARVPLALRVKVYLSRGRLDREIAAGHGANAKTERALRIEQLTRPRAQRELARCLRGVIEYADRHGSRRMNSAVMVEPAAVRQGRCALLELTERLERAGPANPRGVVLATRMLTDGRSPLFDRNAEQTVAEAAAEVMEGLDASPTIAVLPA